MKWKKWKDGNSQIDIINQDMAMSTQARQLYAAKLGKSRQVAATRNSGIQAVGS